MKIPARPTHAALLMLVACAIVLAGECIWSNPVVIDEFAHVPAGLSHWDLGRHFLYRENPPLVRMMAALPVWCSRPAMSYAKAATTYRSEWEVGGDFILMHGKHHHQLFIEARCVILMLCVGCGILIFRWAGQNYGGPAAAVCASIWLLDPTVLANSAIATVDVGAALFSFGATYLFWRFLRQPNAANATMAGAALGAAQACKFSSLALYPSWLVLILIARLLPAGGAHQTHELPRRPSWRRLGAIYVLSIVSLDALYAFDKIGKPVGSFDFMSRLLSGQATLDLREPPDGNRFRATWIADLPAPLPEDYIRGFDSQKWDEEWGFLRLSRGRLVLRGSWYSPLETLAYKLPLGTLALGLGAALYWIFQSRRIRLTESVAVVPALAFLALLGTQTGLNWPARYVLPAMPFIALAVGRPVQAGWAHPVWRWGIAACVAWNAAAVMHARPHLLSYGNELVGGLDGARREFVGSNFDWGQDLYRLTRWRSLHPAERPLALIYYGAPNPARFELDEAGLPNSFLRTAAVASQASTPVCRKPFFLAISANILIGEPGRVRFESGLRITARLRSPRLRFENAIARIGQTIYIFRIVPTAAQATSQKDITFSELQSCIEEASLGDNWQHIIL